MCSPDCIYINYVAQIDVHWEILVLLRHAFFLLFKLNYSNVFTMDVKGHQCVGERHLALGGSVIPVK